MVGPLLGAIGGMEPLRGGLLSEVMAGPDSFFFVLPS